MDKKLIALLPCTLLIAIITFLLWKFLPGTKPFDYGITIDAGSSHSEVILYKWSEKINGTGHAEQMSNQEIMTGIDDHGEDVGSTVNELYNAVNSIVVQIPEEVQGPFPLFLGATAGIRVLNLSKPELVTRIMESIKVNLSRSVFPDGRSLKVKQVTILPGTEEGLYAWVTANYLINFKLNDDESIESFDWNKPSEEENAQRKYHLNTSLPTIGILDMGGASSQVAYQTASLGNGEGDQSINSVTLFGEKYSVKSHSNLCFGSDQGYIRYLFELFRRHILENSVNIADYVATNLSKPLTVADPCNFDSPRETREASEFITNPCLKTFRPLAEIDISTVSITYEPTMNHSKCAAIIIDLIDNAYCDLTYRLCPTSDSGPLPVDTHFLAISSYYFSAKPLPSIANGGDTFTNDTDYLDQVASWCTTPWSEKVKLSDIEFTRYLCFKQLYIYYTLKTIYQFTEDHWPFIHFRNKIGQSSLSWSLGYMLAETNVIPAKPIKPLVWTKYTFYASIALFLGVCLFLSIYWYKKRSQSAVFISYKA